MKLVEIGLVALAGGAIVAGAYQAGKNTEREWWRAELAAKSSAVKATLAKLTEDSERLDSELLAALGDTDDKLKSAERALSLVSRPIPLQPDDVCRAQPVACLQGQ